MIESRCAAWISWNWHKVVNANKTKNHPNLCQTNLVFTNILAPKNDEIEIYVFHIKIQMLTLIEFMSRVGYSRMIQFSCTARYYPFLGNFILSNAFWLVNMILIGLLLVLGETFQNYMSELDFYGGCFHAIFSLFFPIKSRSSTETDKKHIKYFFSLRIFLWKNFHKIGVSSFFIIYFNGSLFLLPLLILFIQFVPTIEHVSPVFSPELEHSFRMIDTELPLWKLWSVKMCDVI